MIEQLQKLGLSPKEAALYMAALEIGEPSAVATLAKKAGINRTTAYDVLEYLVQRGLLISSEQKTYRTYQAQEPTKLINYLKEESTRYAHLSEQAITLLPELQTHYRGSGRPKVYFYEGDKGLIRVYEETLSAHGEILAYASDQANQEAIPWYFPKYYKRRAAKGIPIRALFPDTPKNRERHLHDKKELRRSRLVQKLDFNPEINFFDNKIMIADWKEKLGIIIESEEIVKVFKQTFELAWEAAEKDHKKSAQKKRLKKN